jgi:hypothetical protein
VTPVDRPRADVHAVALDIDGTLAGSDHRVSERTVLTVRSLTELGVTPIIVTGRTARAARQLSDRIGLTSPIISCNGAVVTDPTSDEHLMLSLIDPEMVSRIVTFGRKRDLDVIVWTVTEMIADQRSAGTDLLEAVNEEPVTISPLRASHPMDVVKVMLSGSPLALDVAQDEIQLSIPILQRSMDRFYESSNPGATKKEALREVLRTIGVTGEQCMGIADGDTDTGWLSDIGIAVAVSNAMESVLHMADIHIGHHSNDSVAAFLDSYFGLHHP